MQKGVTGTHYVDESKRKTKSVLVRFTAEQLERVKEKAGNAGVSVSEYLAQAGLRSKRGR